MRERGFELLGQHATAHTLHRGGPVHFQGEVIAYCDAPTVYIRTADGRIESWRADMCTFTATEAANATDRAPRKERG